MSEWSKNVDVVVTHELGAGLYHADDETDNVLEPPYLGHFGLVLYIAAEKAEVDAYSRGEAEAVTFQICV